MILFEKVKRLTIIGLLTAIAACSNDQSNNLLDLEDFTNEIKTQNYSKNITSIPQFALHKTFTYQAMTLRAPFSIPIAVKSNTTIPEENVVSPPDKERDKQALEQYQLETLKMVGTLSIKGVVTALIADIAASCIERYRN